ncbi:MAG: hypothetical protein WB992_21300 [Bryobacteraceae bacterium]
MIIGLSVLLMASMMPQQLAPHKKDSPVERALALLDEAHGLVQNLGAEDHAEILLMMANAARPASVERTQEWCTELFRFAVSPQMQFGSADRGAFQENALVCLSAIDPQLAASLFQQQDLPAKDRNSEDNRASAALALFPALYAKQRVHSLDTVEPLSLWLGQTGQYPYKAIGGVIHDISAINADRATKLFNEAVQNFKRDPGYADSADLFVDFLLQLREVIAPNLLREGVDAALERIDQDAKSSSKSASQDKFRIEVRTKTRSVSLASPSDLLLFKLFPLIRQANPKWAETVLKDHLSLRGKQMLGPDESYSTVMLMIRQDSNPSPAAVQETFDTVRLQQILAGDNGDPENALDEINSLPTPSVRNLGLATIAAQYARVDQKGADSVLSDVESDLGKMKASPAKLRLAATLAKSYFSMGRFEEAREFADKAFSLGTEILAQQRLAQPGHATYALSGSGDLASLVSAVAKNANSSGILDSIRTIGDDALRTFLLVFFAKAEIEANSL